MTELNHGSDQYRDWFQKSKHVFDTVHDLEGMQQLNRRGLIKNYTEFRHMTSNRTPLLDAVCKDRPFGIIQILLQNGANPFATSDNKGALHWCVEHDDIETTQMILENGCEILQSENSLFQPEIFDNGASIIQNQLNFVNQRNRFGQTPLHLAIGKLPFRHHTRDNDEREETDDNKQANLLKLVELLVNYGADVNSIDETGQSPIFTCTDSRYFEITKFLLRNGAKVDITDNDKETPLFVCIRDLQIVKMICHADADITHTNSFGKTPLHKSVEVGVVTQFLISKGANIEALDNALLTPIYDAVRCGNLESTKILCNSGANLSVRNYIDNTLLHTALYRQDSQLITEFLIKQHLDINAVNQDGTTPFMLATENRSLNSAMLLWQGGADIYMENNDGSTALDLITDESEWSETNPVRQVFEKYIHEKRSEAFAMALHDRLGGGSPANVFDTEILNIIHDKGLGQ
jgi:ankyrin repeat protein